ncbi:MAG: TonB-dependent receptor [Bacteroidales bacterium]|nr:TonB-dependent receptor [Bacteroidales bacterium]
MRKLIFLLTFVLFAGLTASAQMQISGTVTNAETGEPVPGVSVVVEGQTTIGTSTDMGGNYSLQVPSDAETLVFSFVGMQRVEADIDGRSTINIEMQPTVEEMEEVIVLGYTSRGKNQITGSSVQVQGDELEEVPVESVDQSLQGKIAGVNVRTNSGTPGAVQDIRIRGRSSLTAGNEPLFVIDGVPVTSGDVSNTSAYTSFNKLASLSSEDIASVTVLKDASATSAYGARGSNGVIVIETKEGESGDVQFDLKTTYGFRDKAVPGYDPLSGEERFTLYKEAIHNSFDIPEDEAFQTAKDWGLSQAGAYQTWIDNGRPNIDWEETLMNKNAPMLKTNLSARGGTDVSSFYASLGYNQYEATVIGADFERFSGLLNYTRDLRDNIIFNSKLHISNSRQNPVIEQSAYFANPHASKYFMPNIFKPYNEEGDPNITMPAVMFNPIYLAKHDVNYHDMTNARGFLSLDWDIIENLTFETKLSGDYNILNAFGYGNRNYGDVRDQNGNVSDELERSLNYVVQNSLNYEFTLQQSHNFDVTVLQEFQKNKSRYLGGYGENFPADGLIYLDNAPASQEAYGNFYDWINLSYLGMVNYNYQGRYIVDLTYRKEGSSRFAEGNRFGDFWAVGGAWNLSQENFMSGMDFISNLRFRGSYGTSGSSEIGLNNYQALLSYDEKYDEQGAPYPSQVGNKSLSWEKNENYDVGIDFGFFDGAISGSFAYFKKQTYDLLQDVPLSFTTGFNEYTRNVGIMVNKGMEVELNLDIVRSQDFNINVGGHFSTVDNEVTQLAKDPEGEDIVIQNYAKKNEVGRPAWAWYIRKWAGVDPETGEAQWYKNGKDGELTTEYYQAEKAYQGGSALPTYSGGFSTHIDFKGIFLNANVMFSGGNKILERWQEYYFNSGFYPVALFQGVDGLMRRWQEPGDETDVPKQLYANDLSAEASSRFLHEGDFVRLKGLTLGYNLPENIASNVGMNGIRIYARATNYFTWVKDDNLKYDPEVRANGYTRLTTPPTKSIVLGLNLNF